MHGIGQEVNRPFTIQTGRFVLHPHPPPADLPSGSTSERSPDASSGLKDNRARCAGRYKKILARSATYLRARKPYGRWTGDKILAAGAPSPSAGGVPTSSFGTTGQHREGENRVLTREGEADTPATAGDHKSQKTSEESGEESRRQET